MSPAEEAARAMEACRQGATGPSGCKFVAKCPWFMPVCTVFTVPERRKTEAS